MEKRIRLRAPEPADTEILYIWENDSSLWADGITRAPYSREQIRRYIETYDSDPFVSGQLRMMIDDVDTGRTVGVIDLYDIDIYNLRAFVGVMVDRECRREGYATAALHMLEKYAASELGLHQLVAHILDGNKFSELLFVGCNYSRLGCLPDWIRRGNDYKSVIVMHKLLTTNRTN